MSMRLAPLTDENLPAGSVDIIKRWPLNLHRVLAHNPQTLASWLQFGEHILRNNSLPEREREIVILRVAWNWQSDYEWGLHVRLARSIGMSETDITAIARGAADSHWSPIEAALVAAADDIHAHHPISDETWGVLAAHFTPGQLIDLVMLVGEFSLVAMILSSFQIAKENIPDLPTLASYR